MIHVLSLSTKAGENGRQRHIDLQIMAVIFCTECGTALNIANKKCAPSLLASARMHGGEPTFPANSALPLVTVATIILLSVCLGSPAKELRWDNGPASGSTELRPKSTDTGLLASSKPPMASVI